MLAACAGPMGTGNHASLAPGATSWCSTDTMRTPVHALEVLISEFTITIGRRGHASVPHNSDSAG